MAYLPLWKRGIKGDLKNIHLFKNLPLPLFYKEGGMSCDESLPTALIVAMRGWRERVNAFMEGRTCVCALILIDMIFYLVRHTGLPRH
jgi:hypothetical protein